MKSARVFVLFLLGGLVAMAQTPPAAGVIEGRTVDAGGAPVPGAAVRLVRVGSLQVRRMATDARGLFRASDLSVGDYELDVQAAGFGPYRHTGLHLEVGASLHLAITLRPLSLHAEVTVSGNPTALEPSQTSLASRVDRERIEELPVHSRNALDFALMQPGVAAAPRPSSGSPHAALESSGFSVGGLRPRSNSIAIDGLDNNDEFNGSSRTELSPEIVQEYQVVNNGLSAAYGGASGGSINVVTRSGGNLVHGDTFVFWQNSAFNARDRFAAEPAKPRFRRLRSGFSLGGPIRRNRLFFYAALEQEHNRGQVGSDLDPGVVSAINATLATGAFPRLPVRHLTSGLVPIARAETEASGKLDAQLNPGRSLMLRYAFTNNRLAGDAFNAGGLFDPSSYGNSFILDQDLAGALVSTHGSQAVGDLRFQVATRRVAQFTNQMSGPEIDIAGLADFGRPFGGNSFRRENHYQVAYDYMRSAGAHLWTLGGAANRVPERVVAPDGFGGLYNFATLADFNAGAPDSYRQSFGHPDSAFAVGSYGAFIQDHWMLTHALTADIGLRFDLESLPAEFHQDAHDFSPRLGLAFSPAPDWVFRAGYGVFFDRYILANLNRGLEFNGATGFQQVANGPLAARVFQLNRGGPAPMAVPSLAPSSFRPDPAMATPYSQHLSFAAERLLDRNTTVSANYLLVRGVKLPRTRNINLLPLVPGNSIFGPQRLDPTYDGIYQLENSSSSTYNGLTFSFNRRMADELEWLATFTWAKTLDDASSFDEQPQNPFDLRDERSYSLQDQRRRFAFNALWDLPIGPDEDAGSQPVHGWFERTFDHIEVAPILFISSGAPVNPLIGVDANRSLAFPLAARPVGFSRNSLRTPATANLDLRVLKYFPRGEFAHLDVVAEAFNLFNHPNVAALNPYFGVGRTPLPGFAQPLTGAGPRVIEFSLDYEF